MLRPLGRMPAPPPERNLEDQLASMEPGTCHRLGLTNETS